MRACPVGAISKDDYNRASIDYSKCISCAACMSGCPFGAITDRSYLIPVVEGLREKKKLVATFAPAIEGQFGAANVGMLKGRAAQARLFRCGGGLARRRCHRMA